MQQSAVLADVQSLQPTTPQDPTTTSIPGPFRPQQRGLPRLNHEPDEPFLGMEQHIAGRAVVIELHAPDGATRDQKLALWKRHEGSGTNLAELGRAAQALERAGLDWRKARNCRDVFAAAAHLAQVGAH